MGFNKEQAEYALSKTETVDGLTLSGNNHKIGQLLSLHGHLKAAIQRIETLEMELEGRRPDGTLIPPKSFLSDI